MVVVVVAIIADFNSFSLFFFFPGIIRLRDGFHDRYPVEDYLDLFDLAAHQIQSVLQSDAVKERGKRNNIIIGRAKTAPKFPVAPHGQHSELRHQGGILWLVLSTEPLMLLFLLCLEALGFLFLSFTSFFVKKL